MKYLTRLIFYLIVVQVQWTLLLGKLSTDLLEFDKNALDENSKIVGDLDDDKDIIGDLRGNNNTYNISPIEDHKQEKMENDYVDEVEEEFMEDDEYWPDYQDYDEEEKKRLGKRDDDDDEESAEPDPPPTLPVQYDHFCKELPFFQGLQLAQENVLFGVTLFFFNENNPNTLHIVLRPKDESFDYDYLMAMFIDDRGLPSGHFHMFPCDKAKPALRDGIWQLGIHCTKMKWSEKWGDTEFMYVEKDPKTKKKLGKHSLFWSWVPEDGPRPNKLQLRFGFIQGKKLWVKFHSSVIDFRDIWPYNPPNDEGFPEPGDVDPYQCFQNVVDGKSLGNFVLSSDQNFLEINKEYMTELNSNFDNIFKITTTAPSTTTVSTTTTIKGEPKVSVIPIKATGITGMPEDDQAGLEITTIANKIQKEAGTTLGSKSTSEMQKEAGTSFENKSTSEVPKESETSLGTTIIVKIPEETETSFESTTIAEIPEKAETPILNILSTKKPKSKKTTTTKKPKEKKITTTKKPTKSRTEQCAKLKGNKKSKKKKYLKCLCKGLKGQEKRGCTCSLIADKNKKKTCLCRGLKGKEKVTCMCRDIKGKKKKKKCEKKYKDKKSDNSKLYNDLRKEALKARGEALRDRKQLINMKKDLSKQVNELKDSLENLKSHRRTKPKSESMGPPLINVPIKHPVKGMTMYTGCGVQKGCVGDLPQCVSRQNCNFLVTYMAMTDGPKHNYFRFEMYLPVPNGFGYGAVGISTDKAMGDDSVVECSIDEDGNSGVFASWNDVTKVNRRVSGDCSDIKKQMEDKKRSKVKEVHDYVKDCNIVLRSGHLICTYYHKKDIKIPKEDGSYFEFNMEESTYYLLRAYGTTVKQMKEKTRKLRSKRDLPVVGSNKTEKSWNQHKLRRFKRQERVQNTSNKLGNIGKHKKSGTSPNAIDLNVSEETPDEFIALAIWHGNFMLFGCLVLAPVGMFVVRYFKETWSMTMFCNLPLWLIVHFTYMIWAVMFMVMGIIFSKAYGAAIHREFVDEETKHSKYGWLAFLLFLAQFIGGNWLPYSPEKVRVVFRIIHWILGTFSTYFCIIVAMVSALMASSQFPYFSSAIIAGWFLFVIIFHIGMGIVVHIGDSEELSLKEHGCLVYYRTFLPFPTPPVKINPRGKRLRLIMFLWYQFGAAAAFIPIFITNSQGHGRYDCDEWAFLQFKCTSFKNYTRM